VQSLSTFDDQVSKLLELLTRRDDTLVETFFAVLKETQQQHIVNYIVGARNTADENGAQCRRQQGAECRPSEDHAADDASHQFDSCTISETEIKMWAEEQAPSADQARLLPINTHCRSVHDSNTYSTLVSETLSKHVDTSPGNLALVSDAADEVDDCGQVSEFRSPKRLRAEPIKLREYQKELAKPGVEGHNFVICAPTGSGKTYTAGYICQQLWQRAQDEGRRFKAVFIVCIRNLIAQQTEALSDIIGRDIVRGADDKLSLSILSENFDVVVATAQVMTVKF